MKKCRFCAVSNNDDNLFCIGCGQRMNGEDVVPHQQMPAAPPTQPFPSGPQLQQPGTYTSDPIPYNYEQPAQGYSISPMQPNIRGLKSARELAASKLMLTLTILWFIQIAFSVLSGVVGSADISDILAQNGFIGYESELFNSILPATSLVSGLLGGIPAVFIGIGLFMTYLSARNTQAPMSSSGFSMIKIVNIIQFVLVCIVILLLLVVGFFIIGGGATGFFDDLIPQIDGNMSFDFNLPGIAGVIGVGIVIGVMIGGAVAIVFYVILLKFLGSIVRSIRTGILHEKCSTAISVFSFIVGGFSALGLLTTLTELTQNPSIAALSFISSAIQAGIYIIIGVLVVKYKQAVYAGNR